MLILRRFFLTLVIFCLLVGASSTHKRKACVEPAVRKEWRALSTGEKAEWIRAVNVREVHNTDFRGLNRVDHSACHICLTTQLCLPGWILQYRSYRRSMRQVPITMV
jgi:hypothetical protein